MTPELKKMIENKARELAKICQTNYDFPDTINGDIDSKTWRTLAKHCIGQEIRIKKEYTQRLFTVSNGHPSYLKDIEIYEAQLEQMEGE